MRKVPLATIVFAIAAIAAIAAFPAYGAAAVPAGAQVCSSCHGANGKPATAATPIIWGQQANYLYKELHDYHSGARANPIMAPIVKSYSLKDLRAVADYFAVKTWPATARNAAASTPPATATMCKACHGQSFQGSDAAPRLAGLSYAYLVSAMRGFADGTRTNNLDMPGFMKALSEHQREAIARYLSSL